MQELGCKQGLEPGLYLSYLQFLNSMSQGLAVPLGRCCHAAVKPHNLAAEG